MALTTCCKRLTRPEVLSSPGVWGELSLFLKPLGDPGARRQQQLLPPWLAKRRAGLRKLWVFGADAWDSAQLAALLSVLEGGQLADLVMVGGGEAATPRRPASAAAAQDGSALEAALAPLQRLPALQRVALQSLGLSRLPAPLSGLRQLAELDVRGNAFQHEGAPALPPLRHLRALTRLNASRCGLARLPTQLPLGLRDLSLRGSRFSGGAEFEASLHPLPCPGLTRLDLAGCGMATLFPQVSALRSLEVLELQGNPLGQVRVCARWPVECPGASWLAARGEPSALTDSTLLLASTAAQGWDSGFGPLKELRLLTRLDLSEASLPFLPTQLSLLTRLADLRLPHNRALGGAATGLGPLQTLSGLTRLVSVEGDGGPPNTAIGVPAARSTGCLSLGTQPPFPTRRRTWRTVACVVLLSSWNL